MNKAEIKTLLLQIEMLRQREQFAQEIGDETMLVALKIELERLGCKLERLVWGEVYEVTNFRRIS